MAPGNGAEPGGDPAVGLCASCRHARRQPTARGSTFWRCAAADLRPELLRYPPLPVTACPVFEGEVPRALDTSSGADKNRD